MGAVETSQPFTTAAGKLTRVLTALTNGALTFAGVGVFAGLFSLYGFAMSSVGGAEFWGWPLVAVSVGAMVLVIAELASKYPFAGSMYQWPTILAGKRVGWWMGWVYAGALFPLMTAYYASLPVLIHPLFNLAPSFTTDAIIIVIAAAIAVVWNVARIGTLGRITEWAMGLELTVVTIVCLVTFILGAKHFGNLTQTAAVTTTSSGAATVQVLSGLKNVFPLFVGAGVFNALWVLYTFENGGTLGEETVDAGRNAPRAVIGAYLFAITAGFLFLLCLTPSIPDMKAAMLGGVPAQNAITAASARRGLQAVPCGRFHRAHRGHERHVHRRGPAHLRHGARRAAPVLGHVVQDAQGRRAVGRGPAARRALAGPRVRVHHQDVLDRRRRHRGDVPRLLPDHERHPDLPIPWLAEGQGPVLARALGHRR